jgi:hypothetical protein
MGCQQHRTGLNVKGWHIVKEINDGSVGRITAQLSLHLPGIRQAKVTKQHKRRLGLGLGHKTIIAPQSPTTKPF